MSSQKRTWGIKMKIAMRILFCGLTFFCIILYSGNGLNIFAKDICKESDIEYQSSTEDLTMNELSAYLGECLWRRDLFGEDNPSKPIYHAICRIYLGEMGVGTRITITEKLGDTYMGKVETSSELRGYSNSATLLEDTTFEFMVKPDMQIIILEDTIKPTEEDYFVLIPTQRYYDLNGYQIKEYNCKQKDYETGSILNIKFPCLTERGENDWEKWNETNKQVRDMIVLWFKELCKKGKFQTILDYKITTLDEDIYSIRFDGIAESKGKKERVCIGVAVSLSTQKIIPYDALADKSEGSEVPNYEYYLDERRIRRILDNGNIEFKGDVQYLPYHVENENKEVFDSRGNHVGNLYYSYPVLDNKTKKQQELNQRFIREKDYFIKTFEEIFRSSVKSDTDILYNEEPYYKSMYVNPRQGAYFKCQTDCDIIYNNNGCLGVRFSYLWLTSRIEEEGTAEFYYDVESGELMCGEEWMDSFYKKVYESYEETGLKK